MSIVGQLMLSASIVAFSVVSGAQAETLLMPVPKHNIKSGEALADVDFMQKVFEVSAIAKMNYLVSIDDLQGMQSTQILIAGRPIANSSVQKTSDVQKGKSTMAVFSDEGIQIQGVLIPLSDGIAGQTLRCKNPQSGLIVEALVLATGNLRVVSK